MAVAGTNSFLAVVEKDNLVAVTTDLKVDTQGTADHYFDHMKDFDYVAEARYILKPDIPDHSQIRCIRCLDNLATGMMADNIQVQDSYRLIE